MNPILEKIKKLLRMKRGGTPDEVATALRLAQELADKHGIDLNKVNADEDSRRETPIGHKDEVHGARVSWESRYAAMIVDEFFKVTAFKALTECRTQYVFRFVGEEWDIEIAIYVYRFLCGHFRREWKSRRGRCRNRRAFMWGMYCGLSQKLRERQPAPPQGAGLVAVERAAARRNQYVADRWKLKSSSVAPDGDAAAAKMAGYRAGRDTEIRSGVKGGDANSDSLLPTTGIKLLA